MNPMFKLIPVGTDPFLTIYTHLSGMVARVCPDLPKADAKSPMPFTYAGRTHGFAPTVSLALVVTEVRS